MGEWMTEWGTGRCQCERVDYWNCFSYKSLRWGAVGPTSLDLFYRQLDAVCALYLCQSLNWKNDKSHMGFLSFILLFIVTVENKTRRRRTFYFLDYMWGRAYHLWSSQDLINYQNLVLISCQMEWTLIHFFLLKQ